MQYIKKIKLDFNAEHKLKPIPAKQLDCDSRYLLIEPAADNNKIDIRECTAVFCAEKPDGTHIINDCEITPEGNILLELTSQTLAVVGVVRCEIKLYQELSVLSSCPFYINVIKSVDDSGIESSDEYSVLTKLLMESTGSNNVQEYSSVFNAATIETYVKNYEEATTE